MRCSFWDEVTHPIRGDNLTSEVAITSSPSQAGAGGARVPSHSVGGPLQSNHGPAFLPTSLFKILFNLLFFFFSFFK